MSNPSTAVTLPSLTATAAPSLPTGQPGQVVVATGVPTIHPSPTGPIAVQPALLVTPVGAGGLPVASASSGFARVGNEIRIKEHTPSGKQYWRCPSRPPHEQFFYDGGFHAENPDAKAARLADEARVKEQAAFEAAFDAVAAKSKL
jgi:hypothetical protein